MRRFLIAAGLCAVLAGSDPLLAQETEEQADHCPEDDWPEEGPGHPRRCGREDFTIWLYTPRNTITVTANGLRGRADRTGQSVSVLDRRQIEAVQGPDLTRVLQRIASTTFTRNGPLGSFTGLSVRGSASQDVLVLIDGVRANDVSSPSGGFDLGSVTSGLLDQVELLRGPNSLIWGSGALGAVLNITTRDLADTTLAGSVEYGSFGHGAGDLALRIGHGDSSATVAASY
ncbi:MAG TPA: TonB-dependent receptor plug domain-containing protein, partial [Paracoccaceae bacterium]|nr:TonB-dependent receptor plug domain-containing protein [Paracoccaceae bacterium]